MPKYYSYREDWGKIWSEIAKETDAMQVALGSQPATLEYQAEGTAKIISEDLRLYSSGTVMDHTALSFQNNAEISRRRNTEGHFSNFLRPDFPCHHNMVYEQRMYLKSDVGQFLCFVDFIEHIPSLGITRWARPRFDADSFSGSFAPHLIVSDTKFKLADTYSEGNVLKGTRLLAGPEVIAWMGNIRQIKGTAAENLPEISVKTLSENSNFSIAISHNEFLLARYKRNFTETVRHSPATDSPLSQKVDSLTVIETPCGKFITIDQRNTPPGHNFDPSRFDGAVNKEIKISYSLAEAVNNIRSSKAAPGMIKKINASYKTNHAPRNGLLGGLR